MGQELGFGKLLDQMLDSPTPTGLCSKVPAPPSTPGPVGALCKASVGRRRVLAVASFLISMSHS